MKAAAAVAWVAASVSMASAGATAMDGRLIYAQTCAQCHANGVAGAPRTGDKAAWSQRFALGREALLTTVLKGRGAMPPKGGNASLSNAEAKSAADHMFSQVR